MSAGDSIISGELRSRLRNCRSAGEGEYLCDVLFDPGFRGFEGHFEGNPIVPGVCLISLARVFAEEMLEKRLWVTVINQCRFRRPVMAGDQAECRIVVRDTAPGAFQVQCEVHCEGATACQLRMQTEVVA